MSAQRADHFKTAKVHKKSPQNAGSPASLKSSGYAEKALQSEARRPYRFIPAPPFPAERGASQHRGRSSGSGVVPKKTPSRPIGQWPDAQASLLFSVARYGSGGCARIARASLFAHDAPLCTPRDLALFCKTPARHSASNTTIPHLSFLVNTHAERVSSRTRSVFHRAARVACSVAPVAFSVLWYSGRGRTLISVPRLFLPVNRQHN